MNIKSLKFLLNKIKKERKLLKFFLLFLILFPLPAHANILAALGLSGIIGVIILISGLFGQLIELGGKLLGFLLSWDFIKNFTKAQIIADLWSIVRDFTNLFFALILVVIAFATIFDIKKYAYQNLLVRLIIAALLVNFSLVISQTLIDFFNSIVLTFINLLGDPTTRIMSALGLAAAFADLPQDLLGLTEALAKSATGVTISFVSAVILQVIVGIALLGIALCLLIRIPILWLLIIFSPIAWVGWIFPEGTIIRKLTYEIYGKEGGSWWNRFLYWNYFLVVLVVILYFGFFLIEKLDQTSLVLAGNEKIGIGEFTLFMLVKTIATIVVLLSAFWAARGIGGTGATATTRTLGTITSWAETPIKKIPKVGKAYETIKGKVTSLPIGETQISNKEKLMPILTSFRPNLTANQNQKDIDILADQQQKGSFSLIKQISDFRAKNFAGMSPFKFFFILKDPKNQFPLEGKKILAEFLAKEEGKKFASILSFDDYKAAFEILGSEITKEGRNLKEVISKLRPELVAEYESKILKRADFKTYLKSLIKKLNPRELSEIALESWRNGEVQKAIKETIEELDSENFRAYLLELVKFSLKDRRKLEILEKNIENPYFDPYFVSSKEILNNRFRWNIFLDKIEALPDSFKEIVFNPKFGDSIKEIASKFSLNQEQIKEIGKIAIGILTCELYLGNIIEIIEERARVKEGKEIAGLIISEVFSPILEELKQRQLKKYAKNIAQRKENERIINLKNNLKMQ